MTRPDTNKTTTTTIFFPRPLPLTSLYYYNNIGLPRDRNGESNNNDRIALVTSKCGCAVYIIKFNVYCICIYTWEVIAAHTMEK